MIAGAEGGEFGIRNSEVGIAGRPPDNEELGMPPTHPFWILDCRFWISAHPPGEPVPVSVSVPGSGIPSTVIPSVVEGSPPTGE